MEKILSIVIPTYNMEKYLDRCLTSLIVADTLLLDQLEVLVVIDGAKDRSSEIAHTYQNKYPNTFVVIDKDNGNYGSCVNRGVKEARGKYIKVLDADDWFDTIEFQSYLEKLKTVDSDVVLTNYQRVLDDGTVVKPAYYGYKDREFLSSAHFSSIIEIEMHALTYRTQLLRNVSYKQTEGISYTDTEWVMIPFVHVKSASFIDVMLYQYLVGREGQTMDPSVIVKSYPQMLVVYSSILRYYSKYSELGPAALYLRDKLYRGLLKIYTIELVRDKNNHSEKLQEFDSFLKTADLALYECLGNAYIDKHVPYRLIADWRKRQYMSVNSLWSALFIFVRDGKDFVKRKLKK